MLHAPFTSTLLDIPRPFIDPVTTFPEALGIVALAARRPLRCETLLLMLDDRRRGVGLERLAGHHGPLAHRVAAVCSRTSAAAEVFVVTFRTGATVGADDCDLFDRLRQVLHSTGHRLLEWVVAGPGGFWCPRVLADIDGPWDGTQP